MTEKTEESRPKSSNKNKIEIIALVVLLIIAVVLGIPAYQNYQNLEKAMAIFQEGDECLHRNDIPGAKAKFEEAIVVFPHLRGAYEELAALAFYEDHDYDAACKYYDRALAIMPDNPDVYISYSQFMFTTMHYEKARDLAQKAVDLSPNDKVYTNHLDLFTKMCKDPEMVKRHMKAREGLGVDIEMPGAHHHLHNGQENAAEAQPTAGQPAEAQPAAGQPAEAQPAAGQPAEAQPAAGQPAN